jgi:2-polyprenyl-6-methoxyphenol hydroxylase-like FAD-dependent oxidoreductase
VQQCDVVIVGGGIAGAALATALAGDGLDVVVLEASPEYQDRVRGESLMPWGVAEARELGVEQVLLDAGARVRTTWHHYDGDVPAGDTEAHPIPVGMMVPGIPGSLNLRHPDACQALADAAAKAGATVVRGVANVAVTPGAAPTVTCTAADGDALELRARLVVGADGRGSAIRRQIGIGLHREPERHMIAGLLVEGLDGVPDDHDILAGDGDLFMAAFHQPEGRLRVYLCPGLSQRHRYSGSDGLARFLRDSAFSCLPYGDRLPSTTPAGPVATYPGDDSWCDHPAVDGVVLVGDAAGWNDPIVGQGLSIAMRDVRSVRDVVRGGDLTRGAFDAHAAERVERMRRLRTMAIYMSVAQSEDCDDRSARRARFFELQTNEPLAFALLAGLFIGPEQVPDEAFDADLVSRLTA